MSVPKILLRVRARQNSTWAGEKSKVYRVIHAHEHMPQERQKASRQALGMDWDGRKGKRGRPLN